MQHLFLVCIHGICVGCTTYCLCEYAGVGCTTYCLCASPLWFCSQDSSTPAMASLPRPHIHLYMCVCMYVCVYVYMCMYKCVYAQIPARLRWRHCQEPTSICICVYMCVCTCLCILLHVYMHVCIYLAYFNACMLYIHICMYKLSESLVCFSSESSPNNNHAYVCIYLLCIHKNT